jgi:tripartite-type tricarboxylate transporter receptor subunit TctC
MNIVLKVPARALLTAVLSLVAASSWAQSAASYPSRPIHIIVPVAAGGPTDAFGRLYGAYLEKKYKQSAIVENKPGAGQIVGADYVAKAAPDGYTLLAAANTVSYESLLNKDAGMDTTKDILPFGIIAQAGLFIALNNAIPAKTMPELFAWVKANPGKLNVATAGSPVAELEGLRNKLGLNWVLVNYKGGAASQQALLAGEVGMYTPDGNQGLSGVKEGKIHLLAYTDVVRHFAAPDVPTVAESGVAPDFQYIVWLGMFAPANVPADIINKLNADVNEMAAGPDVTARTAAMGWRTNPVSVPALRKMTQTSNETIAGLLAAGVKLR